MPMKKNNLKYPVLKKNPILMSPSPKNHKIYKMYPYPKKRKIVMSQSLNKYQILMYPLLKKHRLQKTSPLLNQHKMNKIHLSMKQIQTLTLMVNLFTLRILWIKFNKILVFLRSVPRLFYYQLLVLQNIYLRVVL